MKPQANLFIGIYDPAMEDLLGEGFRPLFFENINQHRRELQIFEKMLADGIDHSQFYGLFSTSYPKRVGLNHQTIMNVISDNPDHDIYLFSPAQYNKHLWFDIWDQAEAWHKGIKMVADNIFQDMGLMPTCNIGRCDQYLSYCNYWVAKGNIFEEIVRLMLKLENCAEKLGHSNKTTFWISPVKGGWKNEDKLDNRFIPFVIERLVTHLIMTSEKFDKSRIYSWEDPRKFSEQIENIPLFNETAISVINSMPPLGAKYDSKFDFYQSRWDLNMIGQFNEIWPWLASNFPIKTSFLRRN